MERKQMNTEQLIEGAEFLEQLELKANERFDITTFIEYEQPGEPCGTAACALGWMALHEMFGLIAWSDTIKIRYEPVCGFNAACQIFEITNDEAKWLFHNSTYYRTSPSKITKEMVAARMRWLAAGGTIDNSREDTNAG
jgi:hypothetical protein